MTRSLVRGMVLFTAFALGAGVLTPSPALAVDYANSSNADVALSYLGRWGGDACRDAGTPSTYGGQCKQFINCVVRLASGGQVVLGGSYYHDFARYGRLVSISEATKGDIIQLNGSNGNLYYSGMHTAIIVGRASGNSFDVVDSNWGWTETVRRHNWDPVAHAARHGLTVNIWRLGTVAAAPAAEVVTVDEPALYGPQHFYTRYVGIGHENDMIVTRAEGSGRPAVNSWEYVTPVSLSGGRYSVQAYIPRSHATAIVRYYIRSNVGETVVQVDQAVWFDTWVDLGTFDFSPGKASLGSNDASGIRGREIGIDGIRWVKVG